MADYTHLSHDQFDLTYKPNKESGEHVIHATSKEGKSIGGLSWDKNEIRAIDVHPRMRGQGIAGQMLRHASILHLKGIAPEPKTSDTRTEAGQRLHEAYGGSGSAPPEGYMHEQDYSPFYDEDY